MKTGFKKILSMLLVLTMLLSMTGITAFAVNAEPLPTTLEAPSPLVYDSGSYTMDINVKYLNPNSIMDIYEKGYTNRGYDEETYSYFSDYGDDITFTIDVYFAPTAVINIGNTDTTRGTASGHYDLIGDNVVYVLEVTPADGYELDGIYVGGVKMELEVLDGDYIIRDLSDDMDFDIRFKTINNGDGDGGNTGDGGNDDGGNIGEDNTGNNNTDNPQTGDNSHLALWFVLMALSALGVVFTVKKRKAKN